MSTNKYTQQEKLRRKAIVYGFIKNYYSEHDEMPIELISIFVLYVPLQEKLTLGNPIPKNARKLNCMTFEGTCSSLETDQHRQAHQVTLQQSMQTC